MGLIFAQSLKANHKQCQPRQQNKPITKKNQTNQKTKICADSKQYNFSAFLVFASKIATIQDYKALLLCAST